MEVEPDVKPAFRRLTPCRDPSAAFTLAEVVIAMLVLAVGVMAASLFMSTITQGAALTGHVTEGVALAQQKIEFLRSLKPGDVTGGTDTVGRFSRTWSVAQTSSLTRIEVAVLWTNLGGQVREVRMKTSVAP